MSMDPTSGQTPDPNDPYGGYGGYQPQSNHSYGSHSQPDSSTGPQQNDPDYMYGQQSQQQYTAPGGQQQQQYSYGQPGQSNTYTPPDSVLRKQRGSRFSSPGSIGPRERRAALLSYLGLCFTGIFFFFSRRKNSFVRFHAAQSVAVFTPLVVLYIILKVVSIVPIIGFLLAAPLSCLTFLVVLVGAVLWVFLMVTSYRGSTVKLPVVGDYAQSFVDRFTKN